MPDNIGRDLFESTMRKRLCWQDEHNLRRSARIPEDYADPDTQRMWIGWQLAIEAQQPAAAGVSDEDVWQLWLRVCAESENLSTRVMIAKFARALRPAQHPDTERCIKARNDLNAALHGDGALIDDLERAVANACARLSRPGQQSDTLCFELSTMLGCPPSATDVVACVSSLLTPQPAQQAVPMTEEDETFVAACNGCPSPGRCKDTSGCAHAGMSVPAYYVCHPDGTYTLASPQPMLFGITAQGAQEGV